MVRGKSHVFTAPLGVVDYFGCFGGSGDDDGSVHRCRSLC